ncbi:BspA family leucine-rich repeat surface protein [Dyadobacter arcticus]|uniref:Surface protein n=1 Tax=Dyadobacter arcticus TaxID=1078754 RepID=A0ABX0UP72_9BACT|nr:BspA family leucine-rich repeat surface protein [Dyadobacter arcticus]NIJ54657.1 surface protein [Dyadobacter arcticus]
MYDTLLYLKDNAVLTLRNSALLWILLCLIFSAASNALAQQPFITTWKTDNPGSSNSTSITIPTYEGSYNYEIDWNNDGIYDQSGVTGGVTHDFYASGIYTIRIRGAFPMLFFNNNGDRLKLLDVGQWGDVAWADMTRAFAGCANLSVSATDLPNLSGVKSMSGMFTECTKLNGPANIGNWNTISVTDMSAMFRLATNFNQPIENWNTANVTTMVAMFSITASFNQPIGNWNTSNVNYMDDMFGAGVAFNQPIGNWNTANVSSMGGMFNGASSFNQSLGGWSLNQYVLLSDMLNNSGLDCNNYSATLIGWNANPSTPNNRSLGSINLLYRTQAEAARSNLTTTKTWLIEGDEASASDCSALPVKWITFIGNIQENSVVLSWETSSEISNEGFDIEKSANARTFEKIGFVDGGGESKTKKVYHFADVNPLPTTYYRLKQRDIDGKFEYSKIISVKKSEGKIVLYPNPTSNEFNLRGLSKPQILIIINADGKVVCKQQWSPGNTVKMGHLLDGLYFLLIDGETKKVVVRKVSN